MSVWLPRRPLPVAHFRAHPTLISHSNRALHVLASRNIIELHPIYTRGPLLLQQQHGLTRRWQSTKETQGSSQTAEETRVAAEAKTSSIAAKDDVVKDPLGTRVWKKVKHEAAHYWHGSKLLVSEVRISARLQWKILHGETLTRRERRQVSNYSFFLLRMQKITVIFLS